MVIFIFRPLKGNRGYVVEQMLDEVDRIYSTFVTRVVRDPRRSAFMNKVMQYLRLDYPDDNRPILITCIDGFCRKNRRTSIRGSQLNGGILAHGILAVPWQSRLKRPVVEHFEMNKELYQRNRLLRIDVRPIERKLAFTVDYAMKGLKSGNASLDDVSFFPKTLGEPSRQRTDASDPNGL